MKIVYYSSIFLFMFGIKVSLQAQNISLDLEEESVVNALKLIKKTGVEIAYSPSILSNRHKKSISIKCKDISPEQALKMIALACQLKVKKFNDKQFVVYIDGDCLDLIKESLQGSIIKRTYPKPISKTPLCHSCIPNKNQHKGKSRIKKIVNGKVFDSEIVYQELTDEEMKRLYLLFIQIGKDGTLTLPKANKIFGNGTSIECSDIDLDKVYQNIQKVIEDGEVTKPEIKFIQESFLKNTEWKLKELGSGIEY